MSTKFLCRNCSQIRNRPIKSACNLFGDGTQHDWIPFSASDDVVGHEDKNPINFNKKVAFSMGIGLAVLAFCSAFFSKNGDPAATALGFGVIGFFVGGFYKQIIQIILAICLLFGLFWVLDYYKIIDTTSKPNENPPKVKKVSK